MKICSVDTSKKAITSLFSVDMVSVRDYMPLESTNGSPHLKYILCQTVVKKKKTHLSSIMEGNLIYFFKYLWADHVGVVSAAVQVC